MYISGLTTVEVYRSVKVCCDRAIKGATLSFRLVWRIATKKIRFPDILRVGTLSHMLSIASTVGNKYAVVPTHVAISHDIALLGRYKADNDFLVL